MIHENELPETCQTPKKQDILTMRHYIALILCAIVPVYGQIESNFLFPLSNDHWE